MPEATTSYPSVEDVAVGWVRNTTAVRSLITTAGTPNTYRVATRLPADPVWPFLTMTLIDSAPLVPGEEIIVGLCQWDAYAARGDASPDYGSAEALALALVKACRDAGGASVTAEGRILEHVFLSMRRVEEPDTGWARYMVTTRLTVRLTI